MQSAAVGKHAVRAVDADHDGRALSTHEKRQLRMRNEIEKVEGDLMSEKAWQFRGEATAKQRPKDSALEVDLVLCHVHVTSDCMFSIMCIIESRCSACEESGMLTYILV